MKKKLVTIFLLLTIVLSCVFVFVACDSKYDIVGTWETTDDGKYESITFYRNGTMFYNDNTSNTFAWSYNKSQQYYETKDIKTGELTGVFSLNNTNEKKPTIKHFFCIYTRKK